MLPKAAQCNEIDGSAGREFDKGMTGLMTVPTIAALVLATLAAALAIFAWRQRRALLRLQNESAAARPDASGTDAARAMLAALREPALLYGERIEVVNEPFAALVGMPAGELAGKTLARTGIGRIRGARGARDRTRARR